VVAHNPYLVEMAGEMIGRPVMVPEFPQLAGAVGAALYARDARKEGLSRDEGLSVDEG